MSKIKILIPGYVRKTKGGGWGGFIAGSTTVLIQDSGKNILVDPGASPKLLLQALKKEGLKPSRIDLIFLTHYHLDHILNIRLFPTQDIYDGDIIYRQDQGIPFRNKIPKTNIKVIPTPGHAYEHATLITQTKDGKYAVAGDLFWWEDGQKQKTDLKSLLNLQDPFVKNWQDLRKSRAQILKIADFIIPGHGKIFSLKNNEPKLCLPRKLGPKN